MRQVSEATGEDLQVVQMQIGRQPRGVVGVSKRCLHGYPQVVVTSPLLDSCHELFPTVYWLSCPHLVKLVSGLESEQLIDAFRNRIGRDSQLRQRMEQRHKQYALERLSLVDEEQLKRILQTRPSLHRRLVEPGIGGIENPGGIKCLHLHTADYLSGGDNPVGEEVCRLLLERGNLLECDPGACQALLRRGCSLERGTDASQVRPKAVAVVNVGSNSVKMLVAAQEEGTTGARGLRVLSKRVVVTRLADGMTSGLTEQGGSRKLVLKPEAIERSTKAVDDLVQQARMHDISHVLVLGTAAARLAANTDQLISSIRDRTGLELLVISEQEEAELSFVGATSAIGNDRSSCSDCDSVLVVDIGGASTEMALGRDQTIVAATSVAIGALTSLGAVGSRFDSSGRLSAVGCSELLERCSQAVASGLQQLPWRATQVIAVGGSVTATAALLLGLTSYSHAAIHGFNINRRDAYGVLLDLCQRTSSERRRMRGMISGERADSVIGGLAILVSLMDAIGDSAVTVSEHGLLEGMACRELRPFLAARGCV